MRQPSPTEAPLLGQQEIDALIQAGSRAAGHTARRTPLHASMGNLLSARTGAGSDFAEVRAYQAGDDPRHIDWRATARSRLPLTRTYHAELSRPLGLLIDRSASMRFGTRVRLKAAQALRIALWLAASAQNEGRETATLLFDQEIHWLPAQRGMKGLQALIAQANTPCPPVEPSDEQHWSEPLVMLRRQLPAGSQLVLISDFNDLQEQDESALRQLGQHCDTRAVHILDPLEQHWRGSFSAQLHWGTRSMPTEQRGLLHAEQERWQTHLVEQLQNAGIGYNKLMADSDFPMQEMA